MGCHRKYKTIFGCDFQPSISTNIPMTECNRDLQYSRLRRRSNGYRLSSMNPNSTQVVPHNNARGIQNRHLKVTWQTYICALMNHGAGLWLSCYLFFFGSMPCSVGKKALCVYMRSEVSLVLKQDGFTISCLWTRGCGTQEAGQQAFMVWQLLGETPL